MARRASSRSGRQDVRRSLPLCVLLLAAWAPSAAGGPGIAPAYPNEFPLFPTMGNEGASGRAYLRQVWSPYGVSVGPEGRVQYDLRVEVRDLPVVEDAVYRVWATTPAMAEIVPLGVIEPEGEITGATDWHQLLIVVTREPADGVVAEDERWTGPIVLRGFSAGARVAPLGQHSLFQQTPM